MTATPTPTHPSGIPEKIVRKVVARRGRLHAFETITGATTALVVIDLDEATVGRDDKDTAQRVVSNVNAVASVLRRQGGVVAWVLSRFDVINPNFAAIIGIDLATTHFNEAQAGGPAARVWHELDVHASDLLIRRKPARARSSPASATCTNN